MNTNTETANKLALQQCKPCTAATPPLSQNQITELLKQLDGWTLLDRIIEKIFMFNNYPQAMSFVNAVACIFDQEDHHPELTISHNKCEIEYFTHAIYGFSKNDFICAAKVDALLNV